MELNKKCLICLKYSIEKNTFGHTVPNRNGREKENEFETFKKTITQHHKDNKKDYYYYF